MHSDEYKRGFEAGKRGENLARFNTKSMNRAKALAFTKGFMDGQRERQKEVR